MAFMNIRKYFLVILLLVVLAGCQANSDGNPVEQNTVETSTQPIATLTNLPTPQSTNIVPVGCTVISPDPTPGPTEESLFPAVSDEDWSIGQENAAVTILIYGDYQCEGCAGVSPVLQSIQKKYAQDVRLIYRHFPLITIHDKAALATQAAEAAGLQGKFWEMHNFLYEKQPEWVEMTANQFREWLILNSETLNLDSSQFEKNLSSDEIAAIPQNAWDEGYSMGLLGTPFILINDEIFTNNFPLTEGNLTAIVNLHLLEKRQFTKCPVMTIDPDKEYIATLKTEKGDIIIQLFAKQAPIAVNNFKFLADNGWYDNIIFHRVIRGFGAQAGDPSGTGFGSPGYAFINEISPELTFDKPGMVAMANAGPGTNGSQFFITFAPASDLNGKYTIFGQVISGMDIALNLTPRDTMDGLGLPGDKVISVIVEEK